MDTQEARALVRQELREQFMYDLWEATAREIEDELATCKNIGDVNRFLAIDPAHATKLVQEALEEHPVEPQAIERYEQELSSQNQHFVLALLASKYWRHPQEIRQTFPFVPSLAINHLTEAQEGSATYLQLHNLREAVRDASQSVEKYANLHKLNLTQLETRLEENAVNTTMGEILKEAHRNAFPEDPLPEMNSLKEIRENITIVRDIHQKANEFSVILNRKLQVFQETLEAHMQEIPNPHQMPCKEAARHFLASHGGPKSTPLQQAAWDHFARLQCRKTDVCKKLSDLCSPVGKHLNEKEVVRQAREDLDSMPEPEGKKITSPAW